MHPRSPVVAILLALWALPLTAADPPRTISVRGRAEIVFPPDFVSARVGVVNRADDARAAQHQARDKVSKILGFLGDSGIRPEDIATDRIDLREAKELGDDDCPPNPPTTYFEATVAITFKLRDLQRFDDILAGVTELGANRVFGVASESTQHVAKAKEARLQAVTAAKEKARYLAQELGLVLGPPVTIEEVVARSYFAEYGGTSNSFVIDGVDTAGSAGSSLSPRELTATAEFDIVFELRLPKGDA